MLSVDYRIALHRFSYMAQFLWPARVYCSCYEFQKKRFYVILLHTMLLAKTKCC